jgi:CO dehydrogenase nickel-insertion accessory protein CooC1
LRILDGLRSEGYHFVFVDLASAVGALEGAVLQAVDRVICVVTPAASAVQDLYRSVELLRRLGLGNRLSYVANKVRRNCDLSEPMGDLGGTVAATIPFDEAFEKAENRHRPLALLRSGNILTSLTSLATALYPAMAQPPGQLGGRLSRLTRRRHVG